MGRHVNTASAYYAAMNLCILPTRREGFPYALLEAGALEIPVLTTRVTGCVDAVADGQTGLLVEPDDPVELASAIEKLLLDATLRSSLGTAGCQRARELFGSDRLVQAHLDLYRGMTNRRF